MEGSGSTRAVRCSKIENFNVYLGVERLRVRSSRRAVHEVWKYL